MTAIVSGHSLILASAGTGKTFQLTGRFIAHAITAIGHETAERPADLARILATTFTRKAAGEILDRVLDRVSAACESRTKLDELNAQLGRTLTPDDCRRLLSRIVQDFHRLNVLTIDALFLRIGAAFSMELGLAPGWTIATEEDDTQLRAEALDLVLERMDDRETMLLLEMLHGQGNKRAVRESILRAITTIYDAFLLSDGRRDIWEHFRPITQPLDADALAAAVRGLEQCPLPTSGAGDHHARWRKAITSSIECIRIADWAGFLKGGIACKVVQGATDFCNKPITPGVIAAHRPLVQHAAAVLMQEFRDTNLAAFELAARFDSSYGTLKSERGLFRFDDFPRMLIRADLAGKLEHLYFRLDSAISHVLLDEFQDTSLTQFRLLTPILDEILCSTDGRSVFIVGDVKQSLYVWRDAEPGLMTAMPKRWSILEPQGLQKSFRSSPVITDTVNTVFESLAQSPTLQNHRAAATEWCARFSAHSAAKELKGAARLWVAPRADQGDDPSQQVLTMQMAADRVREIHSRAPGATIGVLVRANKHIPRLIYELKQRGIEASEEGGSSLIDAPAVAVAVSLLQLADFPGNTAAAYHIASSPLGPLLGLSYPLHRAQTCAVSAQLRERLMSDGYARTLAWVQRHCAPQMDRRGFDRFEQLITLAHEFDGRAGTRPGEFVEILQSRRIEDPSRQTVRVMSIHKSKGLEFDAVVLPDLERTWRLQHDTVLVDRPHPFQDVRAASLYPSALIRSLCPELRELFERCTDRNIGEELCCLYVALTRAIHSLDMIIEPPRGNRTQPSAAWLLSEALAGDVPQTPGAEIWRSSPFEDWAGSLQRADISPPRTPIAVRVKPGVSSPVPRLRRLSPSSLERATSVSAGALFATRGEVSRDIGVLLHGWFERIAWAGEATTRRADLIADAAELGFAPAQAGAIADTFLAALAGPAASLLRREHYTSRPPTDRIDLLLERSFEVRLADEEGRPYTLSGQMDRLILGIRNGKPIWADIIDYKSDNVAPDTPSFRERIATYTPQLQAYVLAVRAMYGLPADVVTASLLFVRCGVGVEISVS